MAPKTKKRKVESATVIATASSDSVLDDTDSKTSSILLCQHSSLSLPNMLLIPAVKVTNLRLQLFGALTHQSISGLGQDEAYMGLADLVKAWKPHVVDSKSSPIVQLPSNTVLQFAPRPTQSDRILEQLAEKFSVELKAYSRRCFSKGGDRLPTARLAESELSAACKWT